MFPFSYPSFQTRPSRRHSVSILGIWTVSGISRGWDRDHNSYCRNSKENVQYSNKNRFTHTVLSFMQLVHYWLGKPLRRFHACVLWFTYFRTRSITAQKRKKTRKCVFAFVLFRFTFTFSAAIFRSSPQVPRRAARGAGPHGRGGAQRGLPLLAPRRREARGETKEWSE